MLNLTVISWNVGGINASNKLTSCLDILSRKRVDVALIQETHIMRHDINRLENTCFKVAAYSCAENKTKGVAILVRKKLKYHFLGKGNDLEGRTVFVNMVISGVKIAFIATYAPNIFEKEYYSFLSHTLYKLFDLILLGGDMNTTLDPSKDKSSRISALTSANTNFRSLTSDFALTDVWRLHNPDRREYTFYSGRHQSFSRIDYILASSPLVNLIHRADIVHMSLSDHHANLCTVRLSNLPARAARWKFNITLLNNKVYCDQFRYAFKDFMLFNKNSVRDIRFLWDAIKGFVRNNTISFASAQNKSHLKRITDLETRLSSLIHDQQLAFEPIIEQQLQLVKADLNLLLAQRSEFLIHRARQVQYLDGNKPSYLLASKLRNNDNSADIPSIQSEEGTLLHDPSSINTQFKNFYQKLYTSEAQPSLNYLDIFFDGLVLPQLSVEDTQRLDSPITLDELYMALKDTNKGKSPGWDGIPSEFYLTFWPELGPPLLEMIHSAIQNGAFNRDVNTAIISLLHKKGKDPTLCSSYRPLSLINNDIKLYAKILAKRLDTVLPKIIHLDQTGFVKNRLSSDNLRRLLHVIHESSEMTTPCAVLSVDAEKAFDRLEWSYLWYAMSHMGFGAEFMGMLKTLYNNPSAIVLTGTQCSSHINIQRGSRQGCPASPLLFAISLEPLAQKIHQSVDIAQITIKGTNHQLSLYCDDILVYLDRVPQSLPHVLDIFHHFSTISSYKINPQKSSLLPLNSAMVETDCIPAIPIVSHFKYLGVEIYPSLELTGRKNFKFLFKGIKEDLARWGDLTLSLSRKISLIKMNILPRINFYAGMLPIPTPLGYWDRLQSHISDFIWHGGRSRIRTSVLYQNSKAGGLGLPDLKQYYISFMIRPLQNWFNNRNCAWVEIEKNIVHPYELKSILFAALSPKFCSAKFGPIIAHAIHCWQQVDTSMQWNSPWHTLTPVFRNNNLKLGGKPIIFPQWSEHGIRTLSDIMDADGLQSFTDLKNLFNLPGSSLFFYFQIRTAMKTYGVPWGQPLPTHPLFLLFEKKSSRGLVSNIYKMLQEAAHTSMGITTVWNVDLSYYQLQINWKRVWDNISIASRNLNHQLLHFKIIHRFYLTPRKRCQLQLVSTPLCLLCNTKSIGTYMHMMWECPLVNTFWSQISMLLSNILEISIPCVPNILLLNDDSSLNLTFIQRRLMLAGLTAAKRILVMRWKPPHCLSLSKWHLGFLDVLSLELSIARLKNVNETSIKAYSKTIKMTTQSYLSFGSQRS